MNDDKENKGFNRKGGKKFNTMNVLSGLKISHKTKSIKWDLSEIPEERPRSNEHSPMKKPKREKKALEIDPYVKLDNPDEEYLQKLLEIQKTPPSKDFLEEMTKKVQEAIIEREKEMIEQMEFDENQAKQEGGAEEIAESN